MSTELFPVPVPPLDVDHLDAPCELFAFCEYCGTVVDAGRDLCDDCDTAEFFDFPETVATYSFDAWTITGVGDYLVCWHGLGNGDVRRYKSALAAETAACLAIARQGQRLRERYDRSIAWPSVAPERTGDELAPADPGALLASPWSGHEFRVAPFGGLAGHPYQGIWQGRGVQHVRADIDGSPSSFTLAYWPDMTPDERALLPGSGRRVNAATIRAAMRDARRGLAPVPLSEQLALI